MISKQGWHALFFKSGKPKLLRFHIYEKDYLLKHFPQVLTAAVERWARNNNIKFDKHTS